MTRIHAILPLLLAFACKETNPSEPEPATKVETKDPSAAATVTMTPEAVSAAGVTVEPVAETDVVVRDDLPGTIEAQSGALVIVNTRSPGIVESLGFDVGDRVKVGQPLATIRSLDLAEAQAAYRKATVSDKFAAAALERSENLKKEGVISQRRLEADQQQARESKLAIEQAEKRIRILGGGVADTSGITAITSPIDGVIAVRKADRGESLPGNSPLFTVVDASRIVVQLRALGGTVVVPGTKLTFTVDAMPERVFEAEVKSSSDLIDPETRRFFIRCSVDNRDGALKPGMFVTGHLPRPQLRALTVPDASVQVMDGASTVFIAKPNGQFERRPVELGARADGRVAVHKGITAGEKVVVKGAFFVRTQMQKSELEE